MILPVRGAKTATSDVTLIRVYPTLALKGLNKKETFSDRKIT